ncbi:ribonuclease HII [Staphylococcus caledonicus]|uniref:ribonuclease HII n=1 Tax=Staphylococcus TaxID=1279 RepID=UPI000D1CE180|nr:ribonuclease HII [Staphylococcus sp. acrmy]MCI2947229.1 ribonuclease HII [Staphylococcus sp. acrmy]PTE68912.1 ribonuclease HII [Staphylococcus devriesei]
MTLTIKEAKDLLETIQSVDDLNQHELNKDERKGIQQSINRRRKQLLKEQEMIEHYNYMNKYENMLLEENPEALICGIDEVGRGPLAGPVVACAVILNTGHNFLGLDDSKKLSANKREMLNTQLKEDVLDYAYGIASPKEIDELNIYNATKLAMERAIGQLKQQPNYLLIDAMKLDNDIPQTSIIKGDAKSVSIAAASVMAKEYRDTLMKALAEEYPGYDFEKNVGYGTKAHLEGLRNLGITPYHRKSFEPIKSML